MSKSDSLRVVFAGTPKFAVPALRELAGSRHRICAVYTQPDRPAGRGRKLTASPVKTFARALDCAILQPAGLSDAEAQKTLAGFDADVMVVVAYGVILPAAILNTPRYGCLNIHASLLPRWRGAAPIQRAILAGDRQTGVTIMQMDTGLDTGELLHTVEIPIGDTATSEELHEQLAECGAGALLDVLEQLVRGATDPRKQDHSASTYAHKLEKSEARIDWTLSAVELHRRVRAFVPWPVAECLWNEQRLRIWASEVVDNQADAPPGTVLSATKQGIDVATASGVLRLLSVQLPGGKPINAEQFSAAHDISAQQLR